MARGPYVMTDEQVDEWMRRENASRIAALADAPIESRRYNDPVYKPEPKRETTIVRTASKEPPCRKRKFR